MQCPHCQAPLVPGATFCVQCGQPVAQTPATPDPAAGAPMSAPMMPMTPMTPLMSPDASGPTVPPASAPPAPATPFPTTIPAAFGAAPPPSQPLYTLPPSQPLYAAPTSPSAFGAPASVSQTLLGPNGIPGASQPYSRIQALLMRNLSPGAVYTPWITSIIGAVVALAAGLILTALAGALWSNALGDALNSSLLSVGGSGFSDLARQVLTPDLFKLFALAHHVSLHLSGPLSGGASAAANATLSLNVPLTGLLLIPALALTLGGYVSASSDFSRLARYSIARGALVAPFYAVLLAICAVLGSSTTTASGANSLLSEFGTVTVAPSLLEAVLYGLLWGLIFGALGGWIHVSGRFWLSTALATLQTIRNGRIAGALAGAVAALATAILLFSAAYVGLAAFGGVSGIAFSSASSGPSTSIVTTLTLYLLFAPVVAVYGFALATGAPIGVFVVDSVTHLNTGVTISLLNGYQAGQTPVTTGGPVSTGAAPHFPPNPLYYLLILGALMSYLVGGRVAARVARAGGAGQGFVAGALMAVPLSIFMTFAAYLAAIGYSLSGTFGPSGQSDTTSITISAAYGGMFLAVLVAGAVFGGLGGASVVAMPWLGALPRVLLLPVRPFARLLTPLLDALIGRDRRRQPGQATRWIYDGVGAMVFFGILTGALAILNNAAPTLVPFAVLWRVEGVIVALLAGVPLACFLGALVAAFTTPAPIVPVAPTMPAMPVFVPPPLTMPEPVPAYATLPGAMPGAMPDTSFAPSMPPSPYPYPPMPAPSPELTQSTPPPFPDSSATDAGGVDPGATDPGTPPQQPPF